MGEIETARDQSPLVAHSSTEAPEWQAVEQKGTRGGLQAVTEPVAESRLEKKVGAA